MRTTRSWPPNKNLAIWSNSTSSPVECESGRTERSVEVEDLGTISEWTITVGHVYKGPLEATEVVSVPSVQNLSWMRAFRGERWHETYLGSAWRSNRIPAPIGHTIAHLSGLRIARVTCVHQVRNVGQRCVKITPNNDQVPLGEMGQILVKLCPHLSSLGECLTDSILCCPGLLIYCHPVLWPIEIQAYLKQAPRYVRSHRDLFPTKRSTE